MILGAPIRAGILLCALLYPTAVSAQVDLGIVVGGR